MEKILIKGGKPLRGEVNISGAKNSAVAILPATLLVEGKCHIENLPCISDVLTFYEILKDLGAKIELISKNEVIIDCTNISKDNPSVDLSQKMRASSYLLGSLLGRLKSAKVPFPGGCNFGQRPIDQHVKGFEALGANVLIENGIISVESQNLTGTQIYMDVVSVGATVNIILASVLASGVTIIENAAKEPHIVDLANFLNTMGASIIGAGTDVIKIKGVEKLAGGNTYSIIPDQIEAGTFMIAAAVTNGEILIKNVTPKHLESISAKLTEVGAKVDEYDDSIKVTGVPYLTKANVKTLPYPGFPTDMNPQMAVLLSVCDGVSMLTESVWDNRFQYVDQLSSFGINMRVEGRTAIIEGPNKLKGGNLCSTDLRAGAAFIIAGLIGDGETKISSLEHIDRGYENIVEKFKSVGADITRIDE